MLLVLQISIVFVSLLATAIFELTSAQAQLRPNEPIPIIKYESEGPSPDGTYRWLYVW